MGGFYGETPSQSVGYCVWSLGMGRGSSLARQYIAWGGGVGKDLDESDPIVNDEQERRD